MIVLMRHAHTDAGTGRCIGRTDVPLSEEGQMQAAGLPDILGGIPWARICSGPSVRARETVTPLASRLGIETEILSGLDEIDMGDWDGLAFADIKTRFPEAYAERGRRFGGFRPPGGESFNDVADRAMPILSGLADGPRPVLVVTHAGVLRALLCRLTEYDTDDPFHFTPLYTGAVVFTSEGGLTLVNAGMNPAELPALWFSMMHGKPGALRSVFKG